MRAEDDQLGVRTEIKNLNSLRSVTHAVEAEVDRQIEILESGGLVENETRGYDANARVTVPMRDKEVKQDYRYTQTHSSMRVARFDCLLLLFQLLKS